MNRIAPSETIRQDLAKLLSGGLRITDSDPLGDMMRVAARLVLQEAREAEQSDFLGRGRYQRDGQEERSLATMYRNRAEMVEDAGYHRLATSLRDLAATYEQEAEREASNNPYDD